MKTKKLIISAVILLVIVGGATFYHNHLSEGLNFSLNNSGRNYLKVYDSNNHLLNNVEDKKVTDNFLSNMDTSYQSVKKESIPKDAK